MQKEQVGIAINLFLLFLLDGPEQKPAMISSILFQKYLVNSFIVDEFIVSGKAQILATEYVLESDFLIVLQVVALSQFFRLNYPQSWHVLNLFLHLDRLEDHLLSAVDTGDTKKVLAFDMRQPYNFPMLVVPLLFLVSRIVMKLQLGAKTKPKEQLHFICYFLNNNHPLSGLRVFRRKINLFVELDFCRYFGLILVASIDSKIFFLSS